MVKFHCHISDSQKVTVREEVKWPLREDGFSGKFCGKEDSQSWQTFRREFWVWKLCCITRGPWPYISVSNKGCITQPIGHIFVAFSRTPMHLPVFTSIGLRMAKKSFRMSKKPWFTRFWHTKFTASGSIVYGPWAIDQRSASALADKNISF